MRKVRWLKKSTSGFSYDQMLDMFSTGPVRSGIAVNTATALECSTVLACARVIANGLSQVPFKLYRAEGRNRGYGAVFGNMDAYGDVIAKGAFTRTIAEFKTSGVWPSMLSQHGGWDMSAESLTPVGVWTEIREDEHGLYVEGKLADTPRGLEMYALMKMQPRPALNGMSIGFRPIEWVNRSKPEEPRRTLTRVELVELSLVTFPANDKARVTGVKSDCDGPSARNAEKALRDAGFSRTEAKAILAGGLKNMTLRDAEDDVEALAAIVRRNISTLNGERRF